MVRDETDDKRQKQEDGMEREEWRDAMLTRTGKEEEDDDDDEKEGGEGLGGARARKTRCCHHGLLEQPIIRSYQGQPFTNIVLRSYQGQLVRNIAIRSYQG